MFMMPIVYLVKTRNYEQCLYFYSAFKYISRYGRSTFY